MSNKYIIKNCPSCTKQDECIAMYLRTSVECKDRNDCTMKKIVKYCLDQNLKYDTTACDILDILDIQEIK